MKPTDSLIIMEVTLISLINDNDLLLISLNIWLGRVLKRPVAGSDISIDSIEDKYERGLYASGWLATGPTGVILTTMNNSFGVAHTVIADFASGAIDTKTSRPGLSTEKLHDVVTWKGWQRIDKAEVASADGYEGKPREKIIDIRKMLEIAAN